MSQRQLNVYFGQNNRDDAAYEVVEQIKQQINIHDLFKQVLLQIADGSLTLDKKTMRVKGQSENDDLYRMVRDIHQVIKSGQLRLVSDDQPAAVSLDGVPEIAVSREVMDAFNGMDD